MWMMTSLFFSVSTLWDSIRVLCSPDLALASFDSSATSVSDLIGSSLGERAKTWASIRLLSSSNDIQGLSCDMIRKEIKGIYSTTIFVLLNDGQSYFLSSTSFLKQMAWI
jgi:hypothetical protein